MEEAKPNKIEEAKPVEAKPSKMMTREEYEKVRSQYTQDQNDPSKKIKQPKFGKLFNWKKRSAMKKSMNKTDDILVFLLNLKKQIEGPILTKIYGGNFMVVRNHVYRFNPHRVFSFGKYKAVIAREFDRELVGIDDYESLMLKDFTSRNPGGRVNIDDPVLIKALIAAKLSEKPTVSIGMGKWIVIGLIFVGLIVGFFVLTSKKTPTPTPPSP